MREEPLKLIIVDDEAPVRDLLKMCVNWAGIGYEVAGEASCAQEALDLIEETEPDVIFTDICMPYMDGIEFARIVFEKRPMMKIVILTGYEEFEYAKRSIKIGIADFLLKPINDDEIRKVALGIREKLRDEKSRRTEYARLKKQLEESMPYLKEKLLNELLTASPDAETKGRLDYFGIGLDTGHCQVALIDVSSAETGENPGEEERLLTKIRCRELVLQYFRDDRRINVFMDNSQRIVVLNPDRELELAACLEGVLSMLVNRMKCFVSIGIGNAYASPDKIRLSYKEACDALDYRVIAGKNQVVGYSDINISMGGHSRIHSDPIDSLAFSLKAGMKTRALELLEEIFTEGGIGYDTHIESIRASVSYIVAAVLNVITEAGIPSADVFGPGQPFEAVFRLDTCPELREYLGGVIVSAADAIESLQSRKVNRVVRQVREYILQNLSDSALSLSGTARAFYLNGSYLSRIFKQETGQTFVEFLTKARLEKAIRLLRETDLRSYQIAEDIGFTDPHYFGICFKKFTGMSVNDYKKDCAR